MLHTITCLYKCVDILMHTLSSPNCFNVVEPVMFFCWRYPMRVAVYSNSLDKTHGSNKESQCIAHAAISLNLHMLCIAHAHRISKLATAMHGTYETEISLGMSYAYQMPASLAGCVLCIAHAQTSFVSDPCV